MAKVNSASQGGAEECAQERLGIDALDLGQREAAVNQDRRAYALRVIGGEPRHGVRAQRVPDEHRARDIAPWSSTARMSRVYASMP